MAQASATTTTVNQNGIARKMDDMNNHLSSSPRRTAIGKPSLRLSIPTIEQIAETKNQAKLNQTDPGNKKSGSFVKRMIDNCNHSGQLPSNVDIITNSDGPSNSEHAAEVCDMNRVKSVIEKLDKNKRMSIANGKSPTDVMMASANATAAAVAIDVDKKSTRKPSIEIHMEEDKSAKDNDDIACAIESNGVQLDNFLSYSKFENDFKKRINELNSSRLDAQSHDHHLPILTQIKSISTSTPNTPMHIPKPHLNRIVSLSPTIHYKLEQHIVLNSSSTSSTKSSTTTSRVAKASSSQRLHHVSSSSSTQSSSEMKAMALKRDLNDIKNSMSEISSLASMAQPPSITADEISLSNSSISELQKRLRSSLENIVDVPDDEEPLVTFPDEGNGRELELDLRHAQQLVPCASNELSSVAVGDLTTTDTVKFEEKRTMSASKTKVIKDGFSSEQATSNASEMKRLQAGDIDYKEAKAASAIRNKFEVDGIKAEQNASVLKEARSFKSGDIQQQESNNRAAASMKIHSDTFSAEKKAMKQAQQRQTVTSTGIFNQEKHVSSASQSNYMITTKGMCSTGSSMITSSQSSKATNSHVLLEGSSNLDDLEKLSSNSNQKDVETAIVKYSQLLNSNVSMLQQSEMTKVPSVLDSINTVIQKAWAVPTHGHQLGYSLCNTLRNNGGLDLLMDNCAQRDNKLQFSSARLLEQCLTTENRSHVVDYGLEKVVNGACVCTKHATTDHSRVGTGILENLFKHSEGTCSDVIRMGGLDAVLFECRKNDVETLRHCAMALANLSLYGGADNQEAMINRKVPIWLFPLAFHTDDLIKYYACLAIAVLVANKEIEAEVLKSGTLDLVEPFVTSHNPSEFAKSNLAHAHGQSKHWLQRLVPVLSSNREEARNLATFHFCMEAGIKKEQGSTEIFREIGAIEPLKVVASCPNAIASKFAAQALRLIGEEVPHKLSQQVPLWSVEDVREWVKQIGFAEYEKNFSDSRVDGDLLLQLTEENLRDDIGIENGIRRRRFKRELENLKKMADYSSKDVANICNFLQSIGQEFTIYTYSMLNAGVDKESLKNLTDDQLVMECGIKNSIHRFRILNTIKCMENSLALSTEDNMDKTLDVFVSYRRSNGSQLASLLKVHLQLRGFSVFIDVERLEAGKFDNNLLNSIRQAKHFILVLTPSALDRCIEDEECKDWVHREIVAALTSNCNIIPIIDNFAWPETEKLPEDMRAVCHFNGVRWIHDYQDACVDKLERFMRGERDNIMAAYRAALRGDATPNTPSTASSSRQNPLTYQRMHSNDSDKEKDSGRASD
ncbi:NAD(+) hydrolase sarm1 isoform X2 [Sitodiplosis mosellana]|uniref:NAD(+) hydrolase sarm1 isoform X2 n=1 Tax=Sitodiplosis mosellana TaxID=263140 RepID=UPI0024446CAE|nr:NAD(+) hydrolase sarm1 isoform X2 [Sitodiplosis mosellana]